MTAPYREFVIEGPKGWVVGYLQGFVHGRDASAVEKTPEPAAGVTG